MIKKLKLIVILQRFKILGLNFVENLLHIKALVMLRREANRNREGLESKVEKRRRETKKTARRREGLERLSS